MNIHAKRIIIVNVLREMISKIILLSGYELFIVHTSTNLLVY
jgi:hypothetical protein